MNVADIVIALIFIGIFIASILKKYAESVGQEGQEGQTRADFEAPADEIQQFLRSLGAGQQPGQQAPEPQRAGPQQERREERPQRQRPQQRGRPRGVPRGSVQARSEAARERREAQRRRAERARKEAAAIRRKTAGKREAAAEKPEGFSLKQAVIWSEILGPPLALRPGGRHQPPTEERRAGR
ncbi:MAG: hypothetical protein R6X33_17095 [Candidatus Brocadiia bacterium]